MRSSQIAQLLADRFTNNIPRAVLIEGSPGGGKTSIPKQVAKSLGAGFKMVHAPHMLPEHYGIPVVNAARTGVDFAVPMEKFPLEGSDCPDRGLFVLDELPQSDKPEQKVLANLIQEREIHGKKLKPGWMIVATGNKASDRAGANRILSHLRSRVTTVEFEVDLNDWCTWALENNVPVEVVAFLRFRPNLLMDFDAQREINPTPRNWVEGVGAALGKVAHDVEFEVFKGDVGEGPAAEFVGFLRIFRKLPNPDAILMDPKGSDVPTDPATLYALAGSLAQRATRDNFERVITYAERMPGEMTVLTVLDSLKRDKQCANTPGYLKWASGPGAALLASR